MASTLRSERELGRAWLGRLISQPRQSVLLEAGQIVVDRLVVAVEMRRQLLHGHSRAVQAKDTGSQRILALSRTFG